MQQPQPEPVRLDDVLITKELFRRTPHPSNPQAENQALHALARQMVQPQVMLQSLAQMAVKLCRAGSVGVSLLETTSSGEKVFRWNVLAGTLAQYVGGTTPRNGPCGVCLERGTPQLFSYPERYFTYLREVKTPVVEELILPLAVNNHALGTIWIVSHDEQRHFDSEDVRVMTSLADFSAAALLNQRQTKELLAANAALEAEVAERQQVEAKLSEAQRRLELSLTGANFGAWAYNVSTDEFWADDRAKQMHGHAPHEVHTFAEAGANIHPEDRDPAQAAFAQAIIDRSKLQIEYRVIWPDGSVHGIASYAEFIQTGQNEGTFYGVVQDISDRLRVEGDRKRAEAALQESEVRSRALIENLPGGAAFVVDHDLRYLLAEGEALSVAGFKPTDLVGQTIFQVLPPDLAAYYEVLYRQALAGEPFEHEHDAHDHSYISRGTPLRAANGEIYAVLAVSYDITERKRAEAEHVQLIQERTARFEAEQANQMKDEFLAMVTHELQSPLFAVLGWTRFLRTNPSSQSLLIKSLDTIERNAALQAKLIHDLLDISRIGVGKLHLSLQPVELKSVIETAIATVSHAAEAKGIELWLRTKGQGNRNQYSPNFPLQVMGDCDRLQQIVCNLLTNAIKFTSPKGRIEIRLSAFSEDESSQFSVLTELESTQNLKFKTRSYAQIQVSDIGNGISADFLPYVFDRFRQSKSSQSQGGLGLGLAIAHQLVELHGGTIIAESPGVGQGTTFTIKLPLMDASL